MSTERFVAYIGDIVENNCSVDSVAKAIREYEGVTRKRSIGDMIKALHFDCPDVIASFGEDAAVIRHGNEALLLAADGIWSRLMEADPLWAGYCAILVNIHDIAAMGGRPLACVDVLSISNERIRDLVTEGMQLAAAQFGVPVVGGHLHPDTPYSVVDVAILGVARLDSVIYSHTAQAGDRVIAAIDLEGRVHPSCILNWDSVTMKTPDRVRSQIEVMRTLGEGHLVTAGKDISNPGVIGTLGMLLEISGKGAEIQLDDIPRPDFEATGLTFEHWVRMYPGMGFVLTSKEEHVDDVCKRFEGAGITARPIGTVNDNGALSITYQNQKTQVFDLKKNGIMRIFKHFDSTA
jgi:putative methanogenesis marker protein 2